MPLSSPHTDNTIPAEIIDAAIEWTVRLDFNSPTATTRAAFEQWLQAAPAHGEAWRRLQTLKAGFAGVPPLLALDTLQAATQIRRKSVALQRRQLLKLLGLGAATATLGWQARDAVPWQRLTADASTAIGEQFRLPLGEGAALVLNTDTAIEREAAMPPLAVRLRRGEVFAAVSDRSEPLRLQTPFGHVETAAAQFAVRLEDGRARVSVREGQVRLHSHVTNGDAIRADRGESWWLAANAVQPAAPLHFDATGWVDGVIAARDMPLADFLAELARYRRGRITCDPRVAGQLVSGIYQLRDTDQALQLLAQTQSLQLRFSTRFWVAVGPAAGHAA